MFAFQTCMLNIFGLDMFVCLLHVPCPARGGLGVLHDFDGAETTKHGEDDSQATRSSNR